MTEQVDNKTLWNEAAKVGIVFGLFSSACLGLKEASTLTGSTFLVTAASVILWAVEFFGCILLMKKYMLDELQKHEKMPQSQLFKFGRRVAILSGLILASVTAAFVTLFPEGELEEVLNQSMSAMPASMQDNAEEAIGLLLDKFPLFMFLGRWLYCFIYGTILSAIMSRYVIAYSVFTKYRDGIGPQNNESPDDQPADDDEPEDQ